MKTTSCTILQQRENKLTKRHAAFTFQSVHVRSPKIYEYFMVAIISTIHNDTPCSKSQNDFFAVLDV